MSLARTEKLCSPSASGPAYSFGEVQGSYGPESSLHSNVEPGSEAAKAKLALVAFVGSAGPDPIVVAGAAVSTVQL